MNLIDKLNELLQKAINYTQEGLRENGLDVDFQSVSNTQPNQYPQQDYMPPTYPKHPNVDAANYNPNAQQTFININTDKKA